MSISSINLGTSPTGEGGDTIREAFQKTKDNFSLLDVNVQTLTSDKINGPEDSVTQDNFVVFDDSRNVYDAGFSALNFVPRTSDVVNDNTLTVFEGTSGRFIKSTNILSSDVASVIERTAYINTDSGYIYTNNGNVGIQTSDPGYTLEVNGSFAASTKSFIIPHPSKEGMKLQHGAAEGPEHSVFYRGKVNGNVIELPNYWINLIDENSITVSLTPLGYSQSIFIDEISDNKIFLNSDDPEKTINCFYLVFAERKDVPRLEVEF